jgi:hypothetical protein
LATDLPSPWRYSRPIVGFPRSDRTPVTIRLPFDFFAHGDVHGSDLRIIDDRGQEDPYFLSIPHGESSAETRPSEILERSFVSGHFTQLVIHVPTSLCSRQTTCHSRATPTRAVIQHPKAISCFGSKPPSVTMRINRGSLIGARPFHAFVGADRISYSRTDQLRPYALLRLNRTVSSTYPSGIQFGLGLLGLGLRGARRWGPMGSVLQLLGWAGCVLISPSRYLIPDNGVPRRSAVRAGRRRAHPRRSHTRLAWHGPPSRTMS